MVISMSANSSDVEGLVKQAAAGEAGSWAELTKRYRSRLRRMVSFRLDSRLQGRVDPSDVVQDVFLEAWQHLGSYVSEPNTPFFLWLRAVAGHTLGDLHRHHLGARMRHSGVTGLAGVRARPTLVTTSMTNVTPIPSAIITAPPEDVVALDEQACSTYSVTSAARAPIKIVW